MTTQSTELNTPWSLHFDRDGTEDIAVILNADGEDLAYSRPFWLPEEDDPIPPTLAAIRLMAVAPKLLEALHDLAEQVDQDCPTEYRSRHLSHALEHVSDVIAEATGRAS